MSRKFKIGDGVAVKLWSGVRVGRVIRAGPKQISVLFAEGWSQSANYAHSDHRLMPLDLAVYKQLHLKIQEANKYQREAVASVNASYHGLVNTAYEEAGLPKPY